jgi:2'-5' RNA ligase
VTDRARYFLALLPPDDMQSYANAVRQEFADRYDSRKALNSPPHITLQPSFAWPIGEIEPLVAALADFAQAQRPVPVRLSGFGAFAPRVIFINVLQTWELLALQNRLKANCATLGILSQGADLPFSPHLTVAFRDLTEPNFQRAWPVFKHQALGLTNTDNGEYQFRAQALVLLKHDGQHWQTDRQIPMGI